MRPWEPHEIKALKARVLDGATEDEVCQETRRAHKDVREMASLLDLTFNPMAKREWCNSCAREVAETHYDIDAGMCNACLQRIRNERTRIEVDLEEQRLREEAEIREANRIKKHRQRMREPFGANPRKGRGGDEPESLDQAVPTDLELEHYDDHCPIDE